MSGSIEVRAAGKLNLSLDVTGQLPDGYHAMRMVMLSVTLRDELSVRLTDTREISARCGLRYIPQDGRNIAVRAARLFLDSVGREGQGAEIRIRKRIPVGAGMGGGSADAAAVLRAMNQLTGAHLSPDRLREMGLKLGSDVPFCVEGGSVLAEGRGELLTPAPPMPDCHIVICKPPFSIRTPELFAQLDWRHIRRRPDTEALLEALEAEDLPRIARRMYNVFEDVLPAKCAAVHTIKAALLSLGALGAVMTGTGSAVFGIFDRESVARAARDKLREEYRECYLCRPERPRRTV